MEVHSTAQATSSSSSQNADSTDAKSPSKPQAADPDTATMAIWVRWIWNVILVFLGLAGGALLIHSRKHGLTLIAVSSALFLAGWISSVIFSPGPIADAIRGYHQSVMTFGTGIDKVRYVILEVLLPIIQAALLVAVVVVWLRRRTSLSQTS
jgi:hypothetical protein